MAITKRIFLWILFVLGLMASRAHPLKACGHEGWFVGTGYSQLFQFSRDRRLGSPSQKVTFRSRAGGYAKFGHDFCGTRWGVEVPLSVDYQRLNRHESVYIFSASINSILHIAETLKGWDFYWIFGIGGSHISEGRVNDNSDGIGVHFNTGPGLQYFVSKDPKVAIGLSVPLSTTLYLGNNLSRNITTVYGVPIHLGVTVGF